MALSVVRDPHWLLTKGRCCSPVLRVHYTVDCLSSCSLSIVWRAFLFLRCLHKTEILLHALWDVTRFLIFLLHTNNIGY